MTGNTRWRDIVDQMSTKDRAWIDYERQLGVERLRLDELRRARKMTQHELAKRLKSHQAHVSRLEQRADLFVSTLRRFVEALGGDLDIVATFPDGTIRLEHFRDLTPPKKARARKPPVPKRATKLGLGLTQKAARNGARAR